VLGSGWLLDIPAEELAAMFDEVWLFDIKHPAMVSRRMKNLPNVRLIETDISGFAEPIYDAVRSAKQSFNSENINPIFDFDLTQFSYIVSCNILNQLDILILDYLKTKIRLTSEEERILRTRIQQTHLQILPQKKSCLISDE
jgi:hypothetical protein